MMKACRWRTAAGQRKVVSASDVHQAAAVALGAPDSLQSVQGMDPMAFVDEKFNVLA
jgi:hypothetical protein